MGVRGVWVRVVVVVVIMVVVVVVVVVPSRGPEHLPRDRPIPRRLSNSYPPLPPTPQPETAGVQVWEKYDYYRPKAYLTTR